MRRVATILVATLALIASSTSAGATEGDTAGTRFADVDPGRFYASAVGWARSSGVVNGVTSACFAPDRSATRAEVAAMLQRLIAPTADAPVHGFSDVTATWQQVPVAWMATTGITTGTSPSEFSPDEPATRAMIATFLWRLEGSPVVGADHGFVDVVIDWQRDPVAWLWSVGLTTGRSATTFAPDDPVTRGELVTFLWRWQSEPAPPTGLPEPDPVDCLVETGTCAAVFNAAAIAEIDALAAGRPVTAHVHDHRTDCTYELDPGLAITTASVIKAQVLAGVLLDAQDRGVAVSADDAARVELMMHYSHNSPPTSNLYVALGGAAGMERLDQRFGLTGTSHTAHYGATVSTAADRTRLVEQLLIGGGPLDDAHVAQAWAWMSTVSVAQSWGVSAGLPADHEFALKNGFYPMSGRGWRLGTTGVVRTPDGGSFAMTILTEGSADETSGIALVEAIARKVNAQLTLGEPAPREVDDVRCIQAGRGQAWSDAGAALAVGDLERLRRINGGEAAPLAGQRVCA
ncbi:MAG: S-layer homology domain-containing protein [Acidimicrobiales bacterium]